jgi:hypothetical protein
MLRAVSSRPAVAVNAVEYGADPTGASDASARILSAAQSLGAGGGIVDCRGIFLIDTNLTLPDNVSLRGTLTLPGENLPASSAAYQSLGSVLIVNSAATIKTGDSGAITGCVLVRKGLTLPFADATAAAAGVAAFAGTAMTAGGPDSYFGRLLVLGFNKAIYSSGFERVRCEYVQGDCTSGIEVDQCFDISRWEGCHFWPFTTTHQSWTTDTLLVRTGIAYAMANVGDWNSATNCFSYGYATGFDVNSCDHVNLIGCGADYPGALASTSAGFNIHGTSREALLSGCHAAAQGTGVVVNTTAATGGVVTISGGNIWDCDTYHVRVQAGRANIIGSRLSGSGVGVQIDAGSNGAMVVGNTFDGLTTPIAGSGTALERSILGPNQFVNCVDTLGPRDLFDNQVAQDIKTSYSSGVSTYSLIGRSARGTSGAPTVSQTSDPAVRLIGRLYDGAAFQDSALLRAQADGTPAAGSTPGAWVFSTVPSGSVAVVDRVLIANDGTFKPLTDNAYTLGASGFRWSAVWAANGTIQTSDENAKTEIADSALGLEFINALRPVSYKFKTGGNRVLGQKYLDAEGNEIPEGQPIPEDATPGEVVTEAVPGKRTHWGLLAQQVKSVLPEGIDFGGWVQTDPNDPASEQGLRYEEFIAPLVKAVQELSMRVTAIESPTSKAP